MPYRTGSGRVSPANFDSVVKIMQEIDEEKEKILTKGESKITSRLSVLSEQISSLSRLQGQLHEEIERTTRGESSLQALEDQRLQDDKFKHTLGAENFLYLMLMVIYGFENAWNKFSDINAGLRPGHLMLSPREDGEDLTYQERSAEFQMNQDIAQSFVDACIEVNTGKAGCIEFAQKQINLLDQYFNRVNRRHSIEGIKIHVSPIITDLAIMVFENIDAHGEIESGTDPNKISAYSVNKAAVIVEAVKTGVMGEVVHQRFTFVEFIKENLRAMWEDMDRMSKGFGGPVSGINKLFHVYARQPDKLSFSRKLDMLDSVDPDSVVPKDRSSTMSAAERFDLGFYNETLARLARMLIDPDEQFKDIVDYVLERKAELRKHDLEVNSFYTCKIGQGNPMQGIAAGQLEIVKAEKPNAKFDDIVGSGYGEVGDFIEHIKLSAEWHSLYMATSPRKRADKPNVLLIGPQGCGKTEVLRAVGAQDDSIAIFALGSDFLTCWLGEAQKNPKRLFEEALNLQKDSGRHVHILIDEIDSVLNSDKSTTEINLSLEFQQIMDGVKDYPHISVWGTTNNPERIPMPMIRRFAKVLIVGELSQEQRIELLQHFIGFMPIDDSYEDKDWERQSKSLEGATGDIIAKIADHIWRTKLPKFIEEQPDSARRMKKILEMHSKGFKFDFSEFDGEIDERRYGGGKSSHRKKFLRELSTVLTVTPDEVDEAIDLALSNVGIINEIDTAVATYANAHEFLAKVEKEREAKAKTKDTAKKPAAKRKAIRAKRKPN